VSTLRVPLFFFLLSTLIVVTWVQPYRNKPPIRSDGVGYHIWTHALLMLDFRFCQLAERAGAAGAISVRNPVTGICQNKYPPGVALLRLPFMAPFASRQLDGEPDKPLITAWEHRMSLGLGALALFLTALFCFWTLRRLEVSPGRHCSSRCSGRAPLLRTTTQLLPCVFGPAPRHPSVGAVHTLSKTWVECPRGGRSPGLASCSS
jgi:hypothetical protein